jgi:hypothetical protein
LHKTRNRIILPIKALGESGADFFKTGVRLADPVHADWRPRIAFSLALSLCVRRGCHEFVGGFPDYQLCRREGDTFRPERLVPRVERVAGR